MAATVLAQLASGGVFGMHQPVSFQLLGSERSRLKLEGVAMELEDSLYPLLREVTAIHHYRVHFQNNSQDICQKECAPGALAVEISAMCMVGENRDGFPRHV